LLRGKTKIAATLKPTYHLQKANAGFEPPPS
jgi:hypothetical protein